MNSSTSFSRSPTPSWIRIGSTAEAIASTTDTVAGASMQMEGAGAVTTEATTVVDAGVMETVAPTVGVVVAEAAA
jgi:hypothetical protein